jgi:hypothetical protein
MYLLGILLCQYSCQPTDEVGPPAGQDCVSNWRALKMAKGTFHLESLVCLIG